MNIKKLDKDVTIDKLKNGWLVVCSWTINREYRSEKNVFMEKADAFEYASQFFEKA